MKAWKRLGPRRLAAFLLGAVGFLVLVASPWPAGLSSPARRAAAVAFLMACFWIGEVIPIAATALFPVVLFPLLGVLDTRAAAAPYADRIVFLMIGGFMLAEAMQKWGLHKRIALNVIRAVGGSGRGLVFGFMAATAFLSMWMSNSATAVMMVPIAVSVAARLREEAGSGERARKAAESLAAALMLGLAYAASIGGIATKIGTPPNAVFAGQVKVLFPQAPEVFFDQWLMIGLPVSAVMLIAAWLLLTRVLFPASRELIRSDRRMIQEELSRLGPMNRGEKTVLFVFALTALSWMTLRLWKRVLPLEIDVHDSTVAMAAALALFLLPVDLDRGEFALDWKSAARIPWGVLILFGGGFSLAAGLHESGFAGWAGSALSSLSGLSPFLLVVLVCLLMTFLTEVTMNTSTATIMMPVLAFTAQGLRVHPFLLMVPATISASCAFMLPSATPPNAIVFGSGMVSLPQMAKAGIWLNLIGVAVVSVLVYFLGGWAFHADLSAVPAWAGALSP